MKPLSIELTAFRSFDKTGTFYFGDTPGLYAIGGINEKDALLDSNGCGKSTIINGMYWALFGSTIDGQRAANVHTWGSSKQTKALFIFDDCGTKRSIERHHSPNALLLDGKNATQDQVEDAVGYSSTIFQYGVMQGQFNDSFFDLKPAAALTLLTDILELDKWDRYQEEASRQCVDIDNDQRKGALHEERIAAALEELEQTSYTEDTARWEDGVATSLDAMEARHADLCISIDAAKATLGDLVDPGEIPIMSSEGAVDQLAENLIAAKGAGREAAFAVSTVEKALQKTKGLTGNCSKCGQNIPKSHVQTAAAAYEQELIPLAAAVKKRAAEIMVADDALQQARSARRRAHDAHTQKIEARTALILKKERAEADLRALSAEADRVEAAYEEKRREENPFAKKQSALQERKKKVKRTLAEAVKDNARFASAKEHVSYWVRGFRDVKLSMTRKALAAFEMETNKAMMALGLTGWSIRLTLEQDTKSGTVSRGFRAEITCPSSKGPVTLASLSGGEAQRVRLAGTIGVMGLIQNNGRTCDTIILDEPSRHLNTTGVLALMESLQSYAASNKKRIWVIDHTLRDFPYAGVVNVTKTEEGSFIE